MKARLLSLFTMVMMAFGVQAQWTAPVAPESPIQGVDYEADGTTLYYIYNVGCGQFVTGANNWSTQISLGTNCEPYLEIVVEPMSEDEVDIYPNAVKLRLNPNKEQTVHGAGGDRSFTGTYLFRDNETSGFVDRGSQTVWYWNFEKTPSGNYHWHSAYDMGFDAQYEYAAGTAAGAAVVFNAAEDAANIEWAFVPVETLDKDAIAPYAAAMALYTAKLDLYNTLMEAKDAGVNTDAAGAVYNNADATIEELNVATAKLKADIKEAEFGDKWADASEDNPLDVTDDVMINPSFDFDNGREGWNVTGTITAISAWNSQGPNDLGTMGQIGDDSWGKNCETYHATFDISQYIDFLPAGVYKFTCQGFYRPDDEDVPAELYAIFPDGSEQVSYISSIDDYATTDRLYASMNSDGSTAWFSDANRNGKYVPNGMNGAIYHFRHHTGDNEELDYTSVLNIVVTEPIAGITIGIRTKSSGTWVIFDNFTLTYYGKVDPFKLELQDLIKKNDQLYSNIIDDLKANEQVKSNYESTMDAARDAEGDYENMFNTLKAATEALVASVADYKELAKVMAETRELADKLEAEHQDWEDLVSSVSELADDIEAKYEDALADHAYLEEVRDKARNSIIDAIADGSVQIKEGDDLTILLKNADFQKYDTDVHTVPGWEGKVKELSKQWGDIENYGDYGAGHIEQTIKNMPMGAYDITVQGFVRGNRSKVTLFAGDSKTNFKYVTEEYATEPSFGTPEDCTGHPYDNVGELEDGTVVYYPNSMQGAAAAFAKINPVTGEPFYTNHCRIVLTKAGDLTIGVDVKEAVDEEIWAIWDNFRIAYAGSSIELFADEIRNRQEAVRNALNDDEAFVTQQAAVLADAAISAGDEALAGTSVEDVFAAMNQLEEAEAYIKAAAALAQELAETAEFYGSMLDLVDSSDDAYRELVINAWTPQPDEYDSNEAIQAAIDGIKDGWTAYVMYDVKNTASADNPEEVTLVIYNPDYTDPIYMEDSDAGWDITTDGGSHAASQGELECFNNNSFVVQQQLRGLEPGFYTLGVSAFYRAGLPGDQTDSLIYVQNAILFAETQAGLFTEPLANAVTGGQAVPEEIGGESHIVIESQGIDVYIPNDMTAAKQYLDLGYYPNEKTFEVGEDGLATIGIRKDVHLDGDWTIFTGWTLYYLGKVAPDAIEDIQNAEEAKAKNSAMYDLSGRQITGKLQKGIYIKGNRKVLVK